MRQCETLQVSEGTAWTWRLAVKSADETHRFLVLGFQNGNRTEQTANPSIFDSCNIDNIQIKMLSRFYPMQQENLMFPANDYSRAFLNVSEFRTWLDSILGLFNHLGINPIDFNSLPILCFQFVETSS